jgi:hypothetical protein
MSYNTRVNLHVREPVFKYILLSLIHTFDTESINEHGSDSALFASSQSHMGRGHPAVRNHSEICRSYCIGGLSLDATLEWTETYVEYKPSPVWKF